MGQRLSTVAASTPVVQVRLTVDDYDYVHVQLRLVHVA
jgi:hypothetical protein